MTTNDVLRMPPSQLAALLAERAGEDPALLHRLQELIREERARPVAAPPVAAPPVAAYRPGPASMPPAEDGGPFMVGNSGAMSTVFEQIRRFATCDVPVLITGESGTGKELAARAIHERSQRAKGPFVAINCAAMPASLIASELFGYEKGAFTGAAARKHGQIEYANGGTLLLDEIGDLPIDLQGHLLRFLQEGKIVRVGGHETIKVNVRIVAATNVRLREAIADGRFREDLFYRLNVLSLHLPPLRERGGDVEVLATYFLRQIARELNREVIGFASEAIAAMQAHPWPGNVREMIATIRRAVVLGNTPMVQLADLCLEAPVQRAVLLPKGRRPRPGSKSERTILVEALQQAGHNVTRAAQELNVSRVTLYRMLRRNGLELRRDHMVHDPGFAESQGRQPEAAAS